MASAMPPPPPPPPPPPSMMAGGGVTAPPPPPPAVGGGVAAPEVPVVPVAAAELAAPVDDGGATPAAVGGGVDTGSVQPKSPVVHGTYEAAEEEEEEEVMVKTEFVWADGAEHDVKLSGAWNGWMPGTSGGVQRGKQRVRQLWDGWDVWQGMCEGRTCRFGYVAIVVE